MKTPSKIKLHLYGLTLAALIGPLNAYSVSGSGNGGDICEDRIKTIRDDIASWIDKGGPAKLSLPSNISLERYNAGMLTEIARAKVSCTNDKVTVESVEKTCKNIIDPKLGSQIVCNRNQLMNDTSDSDQYVLIHHEYAGLAGLEKSDGGDSIYPISNQISGYLENEVVKKLVVSQQELVDCVAMDSSTEPVGTRCNTFNNAVYERVSKAGFGAAWKGPDGLVWSDLIGEATQAGAALKCQKLGGRLPTQQEFQRNEMYGLRQILPNMRDHYFWSASPGTHAARFFYYAFGGSNGIPFFYNPELDFISFRCVAL
ncbi:MAG: hypothetical protein ACJ763_08105 [Bdellovibrionia bacterium]